jgi:hypothetical protein
MSSPRGRVEFEPETGNSSGDESCCMAIIDEELRALHALNLQETSFNKGGVIDVSYLPKEKHSSTESWIFSAKTP